MVHIVQRFVYFYELSKIKFRVLLREKTKS